MGIQLFPTLCVSFICVRVHQEETESNANGSSAFKKGLLKEEIKNFGS